MPTNEGLPGGSTSSFSASSVAPTLASVTSTLTVGTYTGAPGPTAFGDFPVTVTSTDGSNPSGSRQGSTDIHIYDFSLSATPSNLAILATSSGTNSIAVQVALIAGSTSTGLPTVITLSLAGLPSGATGTFSSVSGPASGFSSTLTITTVKTPSGAYTLTVTGTDGRSPEGGARTILPTLQVLSPQQATQLLINQVNALKSSGVLTSSQAGHITNPLTQAIISLNAGKTKTALNQLGATVNVINSFVQDGVLTQAQANNLLNPPLGISAIITSIIS